MGIEPANRETAVHSSIKVPGIEADYEIGSKLEYFTLGNLITYLESIIEIDSSTIFNVGLCNPHSWRGDYYELAFEPTRNIHVREMLNLAQASLGVEFQGYKGEWFLMHEYTYVYVDYVGNASGTQLSFMLLEAMREW